MPVQPEFDAQALRTARVRAGLTQHELARLIGVAGGERVSRWELGTSTPQAAIVGRLARVLEMSALELYQAVDGPPDLRTLRLAAGYSSREVARRVNAASATYMRWEAGAFSRIPSEASLQPLAGLLGVDLLAVHRALEQSRARAQG